MNRQTIVYLTLSAQEKSFITLMSEGLEHTYMELLWCRSLSYLQTLDSAIRVYHKQTLYLSLPYLECRRKKVWCH
jgi:hypothetical protein